MANRHSPSKRLLGGAENHGRDDNHDRSGSSRFETRIFGLVFIAPLVLIFATMESIVAWSWSPFALGSVASAGLLALAKICQRIRLQRVENAWIFLNLAIASFVGLVFLGANSILSGTNPISQATRAFHCTTPIRFPVAKQLILSEPHVFLTIHC